MTVLRGETYDGGQLGPDPQNIRQAIEALERLGLQPETSRVDRILVQGDVTAADDQDVDLTDILSQRNL